MRRIDDFSRSDSGLAQGPPADGGQGWVSAPGVWGVAEQGVAPACPDGTPKPGLRPPEHGPAET